MVNLLRHCMHHFWTQLYWYWYHGLDTSNWFYSEFLIHITYHRNEHNGLKLSLRMIPRRSVLWIHLCTMKYMISLLIQWVPSPFTLPKWIWYHATQHLYLDWSVNKNHNNWCLRWRLLMKYFNVSNWLITGVKSVSYFDRTNCLCKMMPIWKEKII